MTLSYNGTTVESVVYNGTTLDHVIYNGVEVFTSVVYPAAGDLITMALGNSTPAAGTQDLYRVLTINGTIAEVVAMYTMVQYQTFGSSNAYNGSNVDTYLNTTFYSELSSNAKNAIVDKTIIQYQYPYNSGGYSSSTHASYAGYSSGTVKESGLVRHVYALEVANIEEYFNGTFSTANIKSLLWNTTSSVAVGEYFWSRSASTTSDVAWRIGVSIDSSGITGQLAIRPALTVDLSKISWSPSN